MINRSLRCRSICLGVLLWTSSLPMAPFAVAAQTEAKPPQAAPPVLTPEKEEIQRMANAAHDAFLKGNREGYEAGIKLLEQVLVKGQAIHDEGIIANIYSNLGICYKGLGQFEKALDYDNRALEMQIKRGKQSAIARSLNNLSTLYSDLGQNDKALEYGLRTLQIREKLDNQEDIANSLINLGTFYEALGEYDKPQDFYSPALAIGEKLDRQDIIANSLSNLAEVSEAHGEYNTAFDYDNQALHLREKLGKQDDIAISYTRLSIIYNFLGQYEKALDYIRHATEIYTELAREDTLADSLDILGSAYFSLEQYDLAMDCYHRALKIDERLSRSEQEAIALESLGSIYYSLGKYEQALELDNRAYGMAVKSGRPHLSATLLMNLGTVHAALGHFEKAMDYYNRSLALETKLGRQGEMAANLDGIGSIYAFQKQWSKAAEAYARACADFEAAGRQVGAPTELADFQQTQPFLYADYAQAMAQQKRPDAALAALESGRVRGLAKQVFFNRQNYSRYFTPEEAATLKQRLDDLAAENKLLRAAQQKLAECPLEQRAFFQKNVEAYQAKQKAAEQQNNLYRDYLFAHHPQFRSEYGEAPPTSNDLRSLADNNPDTLFVTWAMQDNNQTSIYIVGKKEADRVRNFTLPIGEKELSKLAAAWRTAIMRNGRGMEPHGTPEAEKEMGQAKALYAALLGPIERAGLLAKGRYRRLVLVPSGPLLELPFAALVDSSGKRLIESYAVSSKVALSMSFWQANPMTPKSEMLCVADPVGIAPTKGEHVAMRRAGFGPLPGARWEGEAVAGLFHTSALIGPQAKKADVLRAMTGAKLLHFATHGYLNAKSPFYSGLVLAPEPAGSSDDGVLSAREILNLSLAAKMTVLSACETGRGVAKGGDGLQGLVWAFQAAGCPCVVASQWQVDDAATKELMLAFYSNLKGGQPKDDSIRNAMLKVKGEPGRGSPFFWAAFEVIGETGAL